jgi:hypothetical protein
MLTASKKAKLLNELKNYKKRFLDRNSELDESGTRLMINSFLTEVLGYIPIEDIRTEYMIKGTYADYMIQTTGVRHFLVEVKALSLQLSDKHLRQTINYGANEGIEWALLTNGRTFQFYKILFNQPIESRLIFAAELGDAAQLKQQAEILQYLHKDAVNKKSLKLLWNKCEALHPLNVTGIIYSKEVVNVIRKLIKVKYGEKCEGEEVLKTLNRIMTDNIDPALIKPFRGNKIAPRKVKTLNTSPSVSAENSTEQPEAVRTESEMASMQT